MKKRQYFRPKKKVKLGKHWCVNCDAALTSGYSRCPNCGFIEVNLRIRDIKKTMSGHKVADAGSYAGSSFRDLWTDGDA